jgi:ribosomal protein S10
MVIQQSKKTFSNIYQIKFSGYDSFYIKNEFFPYIKAAIWYFQDSSNISEQTISMRNVVFPSKVKKFSLLRSPHIFKKAQEQFGLFTGYSLVVLRMKHQWCKNRSQVFHFESIFFGRIFSNFLNCTVKKKVLSR